MPAAFLLCVLFLTACEAEKMSSLKDVTRPYAGLYQCEKIMLGDRDLTERFDHIYLELKQDGEFELSYETAEGIAASYEGNYGVDSEAGTITLSAKQGTRTRAFTFPYEKGAIVIDYNLFGTLLYAEFRMP